MPYEQVHDVARADQTSPRPWHEKPRPWKSQSYKHNWSDFQGE